MSVLLALVTAAVIVAPAQALADPRDDAKDASRAAARAEAVLEDATATARTAARRLEAANAALPAAQQKVATSRGLVAAARVEARTAIRKADQARVAYDRVAGDFMAAQDRVREARDRVDQIAAASYMGADIATINVLVGARGPQDAMDRLGLVDQVMRKQQAGVDEMVIARRAARSAQDQAGLAKRTAEGAEEEATAKLAAARSAQAAAVAARKAVVDLAASREKALSVAKSERAAVLAKYEAARAEEERVVAALQDWETKSGEPGAYVGGKLLMPVRGWKSSNFGQRFDPYYRVWQLHAGMDIASPGGTPIHAAAAGRIIRAGYAGGYGNYTCISHGGKLSTCYAHQSKMLVHVGEYVRRGEVIGRVGTTGASTGYHLHFETRVNGVPRNPQGYLPGCLC